MSYDCYCDGPDFHNAIMPKARIPHKCYECGSLIAPGETYERAFQIQEGCADTYKTCLRCVAIREHFKAHVSCFCWYRGTMLHDIREHAQELPSEAAESGLLFELGRMAVAIKRAPAFMQQVKG